ncbi:copper transporter [Nocardiopsis sp. RSe5-2]|uniref:Copper transporter n=1 Tax=Nocardiopsis endophytica TaxID=3018445 RepID=A0ABT4UA85_9ACTN|nr:copper transporter [Nocardiopsis endophytica]MDA2813864.1 copper transporter [Nocardiopsis endophytica]
MIDFRYHLVSIVAVFLALTVGLVLGTTMLQDPLLNTLKSETSELREQSETLRTEKERAESLNDGGDQMAAVYAEDMLDRRLDGTGVVVVSAPGADEEVRKGLQARVEQAGGTVEGHLALADKYIDPDQATFVGELADQLAEGADESGAGGGPYERAAARLADALGVAPEPEGGEEGEDGGSEDEEGSEEGGGGIDGEAVLAGFAEAGLLTVEGEPADAADAVLVVAPATPFPAGASPSPEGEAAEPPGNDAVLPLVAAVGEDGPALLAGDASAAGTGGLIARVRREGAPSATADATGRSSGDVAAVLALAEAMEGDPGHYGTGEEVDGFLPDPPPPAREADETGERTEKTADRRTPQAG